MGKKLRKGFTVGLALFMGMLTIAGSMPFSASAAVQSDPSYISYGEGSYEGYDEVIEVIGEALLAHESEIDVSQYNIPLNSADIYYTVLAKYPELFYVKNGMSYNYYSNQGTKYIYSLFPKYDIEKDESDAMLEEFYEEADHYLNQINDKLSRYDDDFSKAVLLHDELALDATYQLNNTSSYTMMVNKYGLCENYSRVYAYLLGQVGIKSEIIDCEAINHEWLKVCLNGKYYNVDVTWDDPTGYSQTLIQHDNFLLSDSARKAYIMERYTGTPSYETVYPSASTYDNYKFHSYSSKFCKVDGETAVYAVDCDNARIVKYNYVKDTAVTVLDIKEKWYVGNGYYYEEAFTGLEEYDGLLYYNTQTAIYSLDPVTKAVTKIASNTDTSGKSFYGLRINGRKLYAILSDDVNNVGTKKFIKELPEIQNQQPPLENLSEISAESVYAGSPVEIEGYAEGGKVPYSYTYQYKKSTSSTWQTISTDTDDWASFKPSAAVKYDVKVTVTDSAGSKSEKTFVVDVLAKELKNTSTISTKEVNVGEKVVLKGSASGGSGSYKYAFYYKKSSKTEWNEMQPAYTTKSAAFKPGTATTYDVKVVVKDSNNNTSTKTFTVKAVKELINNSTISTSVVTVGEKVVLKGAAEGGTSPYKYAFYYKKSKNSDWVVIGTAYTTKSAALRPGSATDYDLKVVVKDSAGTKVAKTFTVKAVK